MATKKSTSEGASMGAAKINPALDVLARPIDTLNLDERNARKHERRSLDTIKTSLSTYGQQKPIVALTSGVVIAGNGTLEAARELGWDRLAVVTFDNEDEARARAFAIMDNRSAELSEWDFESLAYTMKSLPEDLLGSIGFVDYELDPLLAAEWKKGTPQDEDFETMNEKSHSIVLTESQWEIFQSAAAVVTATWGTQSKPTHGDVVTTLAKERLSRA